MKRYTLIFLTLATALSVSALLYSIYLGAAYPSRFASQYPLDILTIGCAYAFFVLDIIGAVFLFKTYKYISLLPLLLMLGSCTLRGPTYQKGFKIQMDQFMINQPRFEEIVDKVKSREIPDVNIDQVVALQTNYVAFKTPNIYKDLVPHLIAADWEHDGTLTVRCVIAFFPISHHQTYIYRPDGQFTPYLRDGERMVQVITTNWAAIND